MSENMEPMPPDDDNINPDDFDDPTNPPPGYRAVACDCSTGYGTPRSTKAAAGPIAGVGVPASTAASLCTMCRGRGWVWWPLSPLKEGPQP